MSEIAFPEDIMHKVREVIARYPEGKHKSALLPVLHIAQQTFGFTLTTEVMDYVASILNIHPIEVYEVATFYSMYNLKPVGKITLEVCHTGPCYARGAETLVARLEKKLSVKSGGTTADGMFTLKEVECLGACGYAPMLQAGENFVEFLDTEERIDNMLSDMRANPDKYSYWPVHLTV
jgi:NADH-quinone oxidoreductase subunit E